MATEIHIDAGTEFLIGAPTDPMPAERVKAISTVVAVEPGVVEAHLPQVYVPGQIDPAAPVLFLVFVKTVGMQGAVERVAARLDDLLPEHEGINAIAIDVDSDLLSVIREADCLIGFRNPETPDENSR